jgi:anti-sigma factor RsiW
MTITREIVKDLLPLYVAGEASADSRAAVEAALREDGELRRLAEALAGNVAPIASAGAMPSDRRALDRTRALLRRRSWLLALSLFFTGLPLACAFDDTGVRFLMIRDAPAAGIAALAVAIGCWSAFWAANRRARVTGL